MENASHGNGVWMLHSLLQKTILKKIKKIIKSLHFMVNRMIATYEYKSVPVELIAN